MLGTTTLPRDLATSAEQRRQAVHAVSTFLRRHGPDGVRIGVLPRMAGMSERALRNAFRREHGLSPKQFDLQERLLRARDALCHPAPSTTVTTVAYDHGFFELGRFSVRYKRAYGETPSQTIRRHRAAIARDGLDI
jgi:AraC family ethanolamine operon transcriptional activator